MKRSLSSINPLPFSRKVGLRRVLLAADESGSTITQMAVTNLKSGGCL